jgi:hypothetical protein
VKYIGEVKAFQPAERRFRARQRNDFEAKGAVRPSFASIDDPAVVSLPFLTHSSFPR